MSVISLLIFMEYNSEYKKFVKGFRSLIIMIKKSSKIVQKPELILGL